MPSSRSAALITGASSGIGEVFARRLADRGHDLILVARRRDRLEALARQITEQCGVRAEALAADLTSDEDLRRVEERIAAAGNLDFLVNNAGFGIRGPFFEADARLLDQMHRLHVVATVRLTRAALPGMIARRKGNIVNVSSVAAFVTTPGGTGYSATKSWMNAFTEGIHLELKNAGSPVRVEALCPGFTVTEFHDLMGVDRKTIPEAWWMSAEDVVDASLRGLAKERLIVIPGARYKLLVFALKLIPRSLIRAGAIYYGRKYRR